MSEDKKEEITALDTANETVQDEIKPPKKLSFLTKFFLLAFSVLLMFHFVTNWISTEKIDMQNSEISELNKEISTLKLSKQELTAKVNLMEESLLKAQTNLEFVDLDRVKKVNEIRELKTIIESLQKNIPEGSKLLVQRLEKKLEAWESYYKVLDEALKQRPVK